MRKGSDIALAVLVVAITAMLLVPLPTVAIDLLVVLNFAISFLLLVAGLYMPSSLSLLSFPTLILLTTLFRLALNVASSRLILSQADAGVVIHAFGTFLIRGEIFVGLVIFTIVTIVNFIVIAKGASRVSEVSARFVLDALPGKQLSVDSDLRSGVITSEQAKVKRDELRKESQLFGAMDGSMKFIQGDAIAGLLIIVINIVGGLYMGLSRGIEISEAAHIYTILTVGDGLVTQVPALLISICAGIVVTRVSSAEGSTLGSDIATQVFSNPKSLSVTGAILVVVGLLPNVPKLPFLIVGFSLIGYALFVRKTARQDSNLKNTSQDNRSEHSLIGSNLALPFSGAFTGSSSASISEQSDLPVMKVLLGNDAHKLSENSRDRLLDWWEKSRIEIYNNLGVSFPSIHVAKDTQLNPLAIRVTFNERNISQQSYLVDQLLVNMNPSHGKVLGFQVVSSTEHPIHQGGAFWTLVTSTHRRLITQLELEVFDSIQLALLQASADLLSNPEEVITSAFVFEGLKSIEKKSPGFTTEVLGRHFLSVPKITQILCSLVREQVSIKDLTRIFEGISEFCSSNRISLQEDLDVSTSIVVEYLRIKFRKQLKSLYSGDSNRSITIGLSQSVEDIFAESQVDEETQVVSLGVTDFQKLKSGLKEAVGSIKNKGVGSVVIICSAEIRARVAMFLKMIGVKGFVISTRELDLDMQFEQGALWHQ